MVFVAALWFSAGVAVAGTVTWNSNELSYDAARGEANALTVTVAGPDVQLADSGASITGPSGCTTIDAHTVRCPVPTDGLAVRLGDGDDHLRMLGLLSIPNLILEGGTGNDVLNGGASAEVLAGGGGSDTVRGGGGDDRIEAGELGVTPDSAGARNQLSGGTGNDHLSCDCIGGRNTVSGDAGDDRLTNGGQDGNSARDVYSGGAGIDTVSYFVAFTSAMNAPDVRPRFISVDGVANDGRRGESDNVMPDVENVVGAMGPDRLVGDDADNVLRGMSGADVIFAGGGDDMLSGWRGPDSLHGGSGDDHLRGFAGFDALFGDRGVDVCDVGAGGGAKHGCES